MADSVDPNEMAHYEPSHLDLHCLHRDMFWSVGLKGLNLIFVLLCESQRPVGKQNQKTNTLYVSLCKESFIFFAKMVLNFNL